LYPIYIVVAITPCIVRKLCSQRMTSATHINLLVRFFAYWVGDKVIFVEYPLNTFRELETESCIGFAICLTLHKFSMLRTWTMARLTTYIYFRPSCVIRMFVNIVVFDQVGGDILIRL
jgi:hypothetical protein